MRYLVFQSLAEAASRSETAYQELSTGGGITKYLWGVRSCVEGYALAIPDTPTEAGVCASPEEYSNLLSSEETLNLLESITTDEDGSPYWLNRSPN